jgi:flagellar motor switch protein FliN
MNEEKNQGTAETNQEFNELLGTDDQEIAGQLEAERAEFQPLESGPVSDERSRKLDMLYDLHLPVSIELGRTNMLIKDIVDLKRGSIVEFEKLTSEPVDVLINGKKMAEGEVVVIEKHFGIRITNLVEATERVKGLGK